MSGSTTVCDVAVPATVDRAGVVRLREMLSRAASATVVVLRGEDDAFCRGLDLARSITVPPDELAAAVYGFARALLELRRLPCATLAIVRGEVRGGGVGVMAACDVVLASNNATVSLPEGLFGLTPAIVGPFVAERVGQAVLRRMALTASSVSADAAQRLGLVDALADEASLDATALRLIRDLGRTASIAAATKHEGGPIVSAIEAAAEQTLVRLRDPAVVERIRAFVQDGTAPWEARP